MKNLMNCPIINSALSFFMKLAFHSSPIEAIMPRKNTVIHGFLFSVSLRSSKKTLTTLYWLQPICYLLINP